ncbi:NMDA receptor-regulated protein 1-domain-containing protein [Syncephalis fuscata]|nr:NMDA receptor-regulated protein 1-domain-containing protein [Syncephalis fuscata]
MVATKRELPTREASQFKGLLRFFEHRQYKRGLKSAEQILRKFPEHGETLAMKGLFLSNLERKEEGFDFVRKGLKNDLTSHICWHVFGLLYRADKNYEEAIKCYRNALRFDKMRNYEGYAETRDLLLQLNTHNRMLWIGYAVSLHLLGDYDLAINVLRAYEDSMKIPPPNKDYNHSELLLYRNMIIEESGDLEGALKDLDTIQSRVCDVVLVLEKRASILKKLNRTDEARSMYRKLIRENPDHRGYIEGYLACRGISLDAVNDDEKLRNVVEIFDDLIDSYPRSNLLKRLPLNYLHGDDFKQRIDVYFKAMLRKGVPSLFANIKALYTDVKRVDIIQTLMLDYQQQLHKTGTFDGNSAKESPTTYLWTLFYLAQHFDKLGNHARALELIDEAICHTPTLVELYMAKARIFKHIGSSSMAAQTMVEARQLDLQDRFVNSKCAKYLMRNNEVDEAEKTIGLFTRPDVKDPVKDLIDMQCLWYELEAARSYVHQKKLGRSLKLFSQIGKHFDDYSDDQFDFHTYCLRKTTIQSYMRLLKFEDSLYAYPIYVEAAESSIKCYLQLFDHPELANTSSTGASATSGAATSNADNLALVDTSKMSPSELKKHMSKLRKQEAKNKEQQQQLKEQNAANGSTTDGAKKTTNTATEDDKEGLVYLNDKDPLVAATKWLTVLQEHCSTRISTHLLGFEVAIRKKKPLLALASLNRAMAIEADHPDYAMQIVKLHQAQLNSTLPQEGKAILETSLNELLNGITPAKFAQSSFERHCKIPSYLIANAVACRNAGVKNTDDLVKNAIQEHGKTWSLKDIHNIESDIVNYWFSTETLNDQLAQLKKDQYPQTVMSATIPSA